MKIQQGFSLLELMITVAIIGIIASVAIPSYGDYVTRGKVAEAPSSLANGRVQLEQYFQDNRFYDGGPCPEDSENFGYACVTAAATYTITATGTGTVSAFSYTINESNVKTSTTPWGNSADSWLLKHP